MTYLSFMDFTGLDEIVKEQYHEIGIFLAASGSVRGTSPFSLDHLGDKSLPQGHVSLAPVRGDERIGLLGDCDCYVQNVQRPGKCGGGVVHRESHGDLEYLLPVGYRASQSSQHQVTLELVLRHRPLRVADGRASGECAHKVFLTSNSWNG